MIEADEILLKLPAILRKNGFMYTLVFRERDRAIYGQQVCKNCQYFEVFQIRIRPSCIFKGRYFPAREVFPSNEDFGKTAWTFRSYRRAFQKFNSLSHE